MSVLKELNPDMEFAKKMDLEDPLSEFRNRFYLPEGKIYMDGNSLGLMSKESEMSISDILSDWKYKGIDGWLDGTPPWFYFSEEIGETMADLIGAGSKEVICTGSTTVNIHSVLSSFYQPRGEKNQIVADQLNFPSDIYALKSQILMRGLNPEETLILATSKDGLTLDEDQLVSLMGDRVALVFLPSVLYRSGQLLDIEYLTQEAHKRGILIGLDCSHSAGVIPHKLTEWGVDFAVWCSYKYLNGGPGSPAFIYINKKHFNVKPKLTGWWGYKKDKQFDLSLEFQSEKNAGGWQISTPAIISAASLNGALKVSQEAGIHRIREKSIRLTEYLIYLVDYFLSEKPYSVVIATPREPNARSGHVTLLREDGMRICEALKAKGVIPDYRPDNLIRFAPIALYNTYEEVWMVVNTLKNILDSGDYKNLPMKRKGVS